MDGFPRPVCALLPRFSDHPLARCPAQHPTPGHTHSPTHYHLVYLCRSLSHPFLWL